MVLFWMRCRLVESMIVRETGSLSEHSNNHSGAHIQNTKHGEENYAHGGFRDAILLEGPLLSLNINTFLVHLGSMYKL